MADTRKVYPDHELGTFDTILSTGQYSFIDPVDALYKKVYGLLGEFKPRFFRSHNQYHDDYCDNTGMDNFQIVEPFPPEAREYIWNFSQLDIKIRDELENSDKETFVYNIRTCPPWMLDKTKFAPLFPTTSGEVKDKTYQELAEFCARIVAWYNKGGFTDEKGIFHESGHFYNIRYWEILNEQDAGESAIYIKTGKEYAKAYDRVVQAIKKVDPTVYCGGPSQSCVPTENHNLSYVEEFLENAKEKVDFVTIHYYSDQSGLLMPTGMERIKKNLKCEGYEKRYMDSIEDIGHYFNKTSELVKRYGNPLVMVSETNLCLDDKFDYPLPFGEFSQGTFGVSWFGFLFKTAALTGINALQQYQFYCPAHRSVHLKNYLSMVNNTNGEPHLTYWLMKGLSEFFKPGGVIVDNDFKGDIEVLSVKYTASNSMSLLVINKTVAETGEERFSGRDVHIRINLADCHKINEKSLKMMIFDRIHKEYRYLDSHKLVINENNEVSFSIYGYGVALVTYDMD